MMLSNRMTENSLLATAAAALVHRMIRRSRPRVLRPDSPLKKKSAPPGDATSAAMVEVSLEVGGFSDGRVLVTLKGSMVGGGIEGRRRRTSVVALEL
jgi:hypothetical protein